VRPPTWLQDTIARRFAVAVISTVAFTLVLIAAFIAIAGVWGREPIDTSALPKEAADMARIIQAAPVESRPALATAAMSDTIRVAWYPTSTPVSALLDAMPRRDGGEFVKRVLASSHARSVTLGRTSEITPGGQKPSIATLPSIDPFLAVQFGDRSWLVFTALHRVWGLSEPERWAIWLFFLAVSIPLHSVRAAHRLASPVKQLAAAARLFGTNPGAPPLEEKGPLEFRQVIRTFNEMQAQIRKLVAYRTTMLAAISHDLRAPLTRIRLRGEFIEDEEQQSRLFRDVDEMQAMIAGALAFFKDDATAEVVTMFDLTGMLRTIVNDYADQGVTVTYRGPERAIFQGRPFALKRAVANLVENAVRYAEHPELTLDFVPEALIKVSDKGSGIPEEALEQVFTPYYRVDKSRSRKTGGVGLGLTAVQSIVQGHGGTVRLRNRSSGGLEASISLPVSVPA